MISRPVLFTISMLACLVLAGTSSAAEKPQVSVEATVVADPAGRSTVLWRLEPTAGWHLYADLLNDAGYPPSVKLELPAGWSAGPLQWPAAERYVAVGEILDHVYHGQVAILQEVTLPPGALEAGPVTVSGQWDWLACREMCVPGRTPVEVRFTGKPAPTDGAAALANARAALPKPAPRGGLQAEWSDGAVELIVPGALVLEFHPAADCARLVDAIVDGAAEGDRLRLRLRSGVNGFGPVRGILHQQLSDGSVRDWIVDLPYGG